MPPVPPPAAADAWNQLGKRLAVYRKARGYTQESLAPLIHYGRSTIAGVETGRQRVRRSFGRRAMPCWTRMAPSLRSISA